MSVCGGRVRAANSGGIRIDGAVITHNIGGSWYPQYPQISAHADAPIVVTHSTIE